MNYRDARYTNEEGCIDCFIESKQWGWIPYTLDPTDNDDTVDNVALLEAMRLNGDVAPFTPPSQEELDARAAQEVRNKRDQLLETYVDPIAGNALRWGELSDAEKSALSEYRKALLNVTEQAGFPHSVIWPELAS